MPNINALFPFLIICLCFSCTKQAKNKKPPEASNEKPPTQEPKQVESYKPLRPTPEFLGLDSATKADVTHLHKQFEAVPFYTQLNARKYYILSTKKYDYKSGRFDGSIKYGLANDSFEIMLQPEYEKISNPNLSIIGCFEIEKDNKVGLANYITGEILSPQFEYIVPNSNPPSNIAYGLSNGEWHKIDAERLSVTEKAEIDATHLLRSQGFSINGISNNMMYNTYWEFYFDDANEGRGVAIPPSFVSHFSVIEEIYDDIVLPDQDGMIDFGTEQARMEIKHESISDQIVSFFIRTYESGLSARDYQVETQKLAFLDQSTNNFHTIDITKNLARFPCQDVNYRLVNDSIIEIMISTRDIGSKEQVYDIETQFSYYAILQDGSVTRLSSNRHYDFTKFIIMDNSHLKGCFAWFNEDVDNVSTNNMWRTDHLSIEDLDIMRNEIFADYGYKFQSEKWQVYFANQQWYTPRHENVDSMLTEIDKANIKLILKTKELMQADEQKFINKRPIQYHAAG